MAVVLVVEDDLLVRDNLADFLRTTGFDVIEAGDAAEAMGVLRASCVDAVVTDIAMPGDFDGVGLARWLRDHFISLPVMLTSGYAACQPDDLQLIAKPYELSEVAGRLREAISHKA